MKKQVTIYTDGASKGNPGIGAFGAVLIYKDLKNIEHIKEISKAFDETTNNRMEILGVIEALKCLKESCDINLYSDSKYVVSAFNEHWVDTWIRNDFRRGKSDEVKNIDLWEELLSLTKNHNITWHWVKGHNGDTYNERCDKLCNIAIKEKQKEITP